MMYCPLCGTPNEEERIRTYQDGETRDRIRCTNCKHVTDIDNYLRMVDE